MGRRNNLDGVCGRCIAFFHRVSPIKGSSMWKRAPSLSPVLWYFEPLFWKIMSVSSSPVFETARNFSWNNLIFDDINEYYTGFSKWWKFHHFTINEIKNKKWVEFYWWNVLNLDFIFLLENRIFFLNLRKEIINCNIFLKLEF